MKKTIIMGMITLFAINSNAQWTTGTGCEYESNGKVGIGLTSCPSYNFVVTDPTNTTAKMLFGGTAFTPTASLSSAATIMEVQTVSGGLSQAQFTSNQVANNNYNQLTIGSTPTRHVISCYSSNQTNIPFTIETAEGNYPSGSYTWHIPIKILPTGQVMINEGFTAPSIGTDTKLSVEGLIACRELKVLPIGNPWPDYVFRNDFKRMSLDETEKYLKTNRHLPQLKAATVIEKEGFNVGETQAQILQAVEELYLHVIDLKKENDDLKNQIQALKNN